MMKSIVSSAPVPINTKEQPQLQCILVALCLHFINDVPGAKVIYELFFLELCLFKGLSKAMFPMNTSLIHCLENIYLSNYLLLLSPNVLDLQINLMSQSLWRVLLFL